MSTVKRFDVGSFGNIEKTPSGGFRVPAFFTRAGVFSYKKDDGTVQKELRPEEEVFKQDSLASLKGAPITYLHPESPVNPDNWNEVTIGHVGDSVERQDYKVAGIAYIQAKSGIEKIEKGTRENSAGYECRIDYESGIHPKFGPYDVIQKDIKYNHVAIVPVGRAGREISLRLDQGDAVLIQTEEENQVEKKFIRIDGRDVEYGSETHISILESKHQVRIDKLEAERDTALTDNKKLQDEVKALRKDLADANDLSHVNKLVQERANLLSTAKTILGEDIDLSSKSPREIHLSIIRKDEKDFDDTNRSDEYVEAYFAGSVTRQQRQDGNKKVVAAVRQAQTQSRSDKSEKDDSRKNMIKNNQERHLKPLRFSTRRG